jgi:NodT family efflux transporter outer membrane factor (OMF) lipoprotein
MLLMLIVSAAGCVKPPPIQTPDLEVEPPQQWTGREPVPGPIEGDWWISFADTSLNALIPIVLEQNTDLLAAAARVDRAAAQARIAGAELKPRVGVSLDTSNRRFNPALFGQEGAPAVTFNQYGLSLEVAWEADLWGRIRAGARAAVAQAQATDADYAAAQLSIAGQTAKTWFALAEAVEQAELARSSAASFKRASEFVRSRYTMGIRPPLDLRLALSNQAGAEALYQLRREELDRATRRLEILLARYPSATLLETFPTDGLPELPAAAPAGLPAEIVSRRPDLLAAERRLAASDQQLKAARRALYPRLSLTGSAGTLALQIGDLLDGDFGVWTLVAGLTQPLFEGGRLRAGVDQAASGNEEVLALYASAVLRAYREVESALAAEVFLAERVRALEEAAVQTVAARRLSEARYSEGLGDYLVVLESQSRALTSQSQLLVVRRLLLENRVDLYLALGGGFEYPLLDEESPTNDSPDSMTTEGVVEDRAS